MTETFNLTQGALERIHKATNPDDPIFESVPTIQILTLKKVPGREGQVNPNAPDRYRLIVSDGKHFSQAMLATQLSHLVDENKLHKGSVVRLEKMSCNVLQGKRLVILLQFDVLSTGPVEKIGAPVTVDTLNEGGDATPSSAGAATPQQQPQQQQRSQPPKNAPAPPVAGASRAGTSPRIVCPIESLSPYQNRWEIRARVLHKSDVRNWSNARGEGKVFSVTFGDETGEISATGFNAAADAFADKLQKDKVYYVSKGRINIAKNKKFSNVQNEYEMTLDERSTIIEECLDVSQMPAVKYNFVALGELETRAKDDICDVIAVIKDASEVSELTSKAGKQFTKRELSLVDKSGYSVRLTLFGKQAEEYVHEGNSVVAFRGVRVGDFGGRSLSMIGTSSMDVNPDIPAAYELKGWFDNDGQKHNFSSYSNGAMSGGGAKFDRSQVSTIADIREAKLGEPDKSEYFSCRATIVHIKAENLAYPACQNEGCNKKVVQGSEGWMCEKCNQSYEKPKYRYMISMSVADHTGQAWLQGFHDVGLVVFSGRSADDLMELKETNETEYLTALQLAACNTFNFSCRARMETFNDISRTRFAITKILPLDYKEEAMALRDLLFSDWAK